MVCSLNTITGTDDHSVNANRTVSVMNQFPKFVHPSHKILKLTGTGRTFVCGDLHGCFDELMHELHLVDFDRAADSLIALGDITDRGLKCFECVQLLTEPWFSSILGNHDEIMMNSVNPRSDKSFWRANGGAWFDLLSFNEQEEVQFICERYVEHLPLSMTLILPDGAHVGLIHGDAPSDWHNAVSGHQARAEALWGRQRIRNGIAANIQNVDIVLVGHTSNNMVTQLGNVIFMDTGAGFKNGRLTMVEVGNSLAELQQNIMIKQCADSVAERLEIQFEQLGSYPKGDNV